MAAARRRRGDLAVSVARVQAGNAPQGTDETDKTVVEVGSVSFGSALPTGFYGEIPGSPETSSELDAAPGETSEATSSRSSGLGGGSGDSLNPTTSRLERQDGALTKLTEPVDPRPDLETDSLAWSHLLQYASTDSSEVQGMYGVLYAARCGGAKLTFAGGRWRIEPRLDATGLLSSWRDHGDWESDRERYLLPHRERLAILVRLLPAPSRLGSPPDPLSAGLTALRALGWLIALHDQGWTAEHRIGGAPADALWMQSHQIELARLLRAEADHVPRKGR